MSYACERIAQPDCTIINMRTEGNTSLQNSIPNDIEEKEFSAGWARTPAHGRMYGQKYIDPFKEDIAEMLCAGADDKLARMGAGRMLEKLKSK